MARLFPSLIALAAPALLLAQDRPPADPLATSTPKPEVKAEPKPAAPEGPMRRPGYFGGPEAAEKARQAFQQMTPEQRMRWMETVKQLSELPPERKAEILQRGEFFRKKMREDVEAALKQTGLNLSDEQKKKFGERYFEERRKMEDELRRQMDELRKPKVQALIEKLKQEFATP